MLFSVFQNTRDQSVPESHTGERQFLGIWGTVKRPGHASLAVIASKSPGGYTGRASAGDGESCTTLVSPSPGTAIGACIAQASIVATGVKGYWGATRGGCFLMIFHTRENKFGVTHNDRQQLWYMALE